MVETNKLVRLYIATGFLYFVIGTTLLALSLSNIIAVLLHAVNIWHTITGRKGTVTAQ